ncbi:hypothetical protein GGP41_000795 [Bipolaris sorokiniana]|uniref:C2H2-type domain-containing protein n=2 Tax=Cochliobolus sativus TaxID=45130 RepID=A0A8H5ZKT0_COCSA|nr:uncharacterized protein COCSADRAFT_345742 [Bipolaris sorokiniana ND90Pr]EMD60479.1 hypothetical protein COCSADRAFT_345742 [Bipolaris sorokiniana ND90Pr]KAF5852086.1 hypothetical protein GGP41_000795 [Bipolaris sorokiniana]
MPASLEPIRRFKCTYKDCNMSFDTEKQMRSHKKQSDEHEYCHKCDEDFESFEDYAMHKITRPVEHGRACRVCGDEFKSISGLKRHIELNHKVDQKLTCIGCHGSFYRASLFIEHLEFGHCEVISASQFQGHIIHKHLINELLKCGPALDRFRQKTSKFDAAIDYEEEGGVVLEDPLDHDQGIEAVDFKAIEPDTTLNPAMDDLSFIPKGVPRPSSPRLKAWVSRKEKSSAATLFPDVKPNPPKDFSISAHDAAMVQEHGINILRSRFWDPMSTDWNPEKFYDAIVGKYHCPFICEQTFDCVGDLNKHILGEHRVTHMKCPKCLKYFNSATALMSHCESQGARCQINKADDFNIFLDRLTGGFLSVEEKTRPDHLNTKNVLVRNDETGHMEMYRPPVASYLEYKVSTPPDWKGTAGSTVQIGGPPQTSQW